MKKNMGTIDRVVRAILAIVLFGLYLTDTVTGNIGLALLIVGAVFLLTSFVSFCPLYVPFGLRTCAKK